MGLRFEVLLYAQLLGMLLLACQYESNVIFSRSTTQEKAVVKVKNFFSHNVSASGFVSYYVGALIGLATLINLKRLYTNRTPFDFLSVSLGLAASIWFSSNYISQERMLNYLEEGEVVHHIAKLAMSHTIAVFFLFTIIILSLLSSPIDYLWDPIELIFLHVLGGIVAFDLSFDFGLLLNISPRISEEHFHNITGIAGSYLMDLIIPAILVVIIGFIIFRLVFQKHFENLITLIMVIGGGALFSYYVIPIEKSLAQSGIPSHDSQKLIMIFHFVFSGLIIFETTFKWTLYCLKNKPGVPGLLKDIPPVVKGTPVLKALGAPPVKPKETKVEKKKTSKK